LPGSPDLRRRRCLALRKIRANFPPTADAKKPLQVIREAFMAKNRDSGSATGVADEMLKPLRVWVDTATSIQSEFLTLWNHRASAYLDLPRQISACRSPTELVEEQIKFLTDMQRDYSDYASAVLRKAQPALEQAERSLPVEEKGQRAA
jgi:hypothetical protein